MKSSTFFLVAILMGVASFGNVLHGQDKVSTIASPYAYNLIGWEVNNFFGKWVFDAKSMLLREGSRPEDDIALVKHYFALNREINDLERQAGEADLKAGNQQAQDTELARRQPAGIIKEAKSLEPRVEAILEQQVSQLMTDEGLALNVDLGANLQMLFPPVDFRFEMPPSVLVISPRNKIEVKETRLLKQGMTLEQMEAIENEVEKLGYSALVENIGGISTYPSIIPRNSSLESSLSTIAHEWLHAYLFFHPLGQRYWSGRDMTTINETVADIAGNEAGARLVKLYGQASNSSADNRSNGNTARPSFDFNKTMRDLRQDVERLLAEGQIDQAESLMKEKQQELASHGYYIRKLNQAYFAFHGNYADSAASISPIGTELRALRQKSASLGDFIKAASQLKSEQDLRQLVGG